MSSMTTALFNGQLRGDPRLCGFIICIHAIHYLRARAKLQKCKIEKQILDVEYRDAVAWLIGEAFLEFQRFLQ